VCIKFKTILDDNIQNEHHVPLVFDTGRHLDPWPGDLNSLNSSSAGIRPVRLASHIA